MMQRKSMHLLFIIFILTHLYGVSAASADEVSGTLKSGYRVLSLDPGEKIQAFTVYRGDYIKFNLPEGYGTLEVEFPTLGQKKEISGNSDENPYFKMKTTGLQPFSAGPFEGEIRVVEYTQTSYEVFTAEEAKEYIEAEEPFVLDVRTPREYAAGHLENSTLIPVQQLQQRISEIEKYKNQPVLVYCATGNRSTVASKILIDAGFSKIYNLRYGIVDWARKRYPMVR